MNKIKKRWNPSRSKWYNAVRRASIGVKKVSRARKRREWLKNFREETLTDRENRRSRPRDSKGKKRKRENLGNRKEMTQEVNEKETSQP